MLNPFKRLILFFTAVPILLGLIFIKYLEHLPLVLLIVALLIISGKEITKILNRTNFPVNIVIVSTMLPILTIVRYLTVLFAGQLPENIFEITLMIELLLAFSIPVLFPNKAPISFRLRSVVGYIIAIIYPGFLASYWVGISSYSNSTFLLIIFVLTVQLNDSLAWLVGILFGRKSRNIIEVSPNKSLVGFAGGILGSILTLLGAYFLAAENFKIPLPYIILLGIILGIASIIGDLVESMLKRAAGVKDSGNIILGRGGVLDSIDSLLFVSPIFYYAIPIISNLN